MFFVLFDKEGWRSRTKEETDIEKEGILDSDKLAAANHILRESVTAGVAAVAAAKTLPLCKLIKDFLAYHGLDPNAVFVPIGRGLSQQLWTELNERMIKFYTSVETERVNLHFKYMVKNTEELSGDARAHFDADLRAFIERNDRYP